MFSSGMEELAKDMGLRVDEDVAYGVYCGYVTTLSETKKNKVLVFTTQLLEEEQQRELNNRSGDRKKLKAMGLRRLECQGTYIRAVFENKGDVMEKMRQFIDWYLPILNELGAVKADLCVQCGKQVKDENPWLLVDGVAYHMHEKCADKVERKARNRLANYLAEDEGVLSRGIVGAVLGALVGLVAWIVATNVNFNAPTLGGLFTVWMAQMGYDVAKGPRDMSKVWTVLGASVFGVLVGCLVSHGCIVYGMVNSIWTVPKVLWGLMQDVEYLVTLLQDFLVGMLFALLAMIPIYRNKKIELGKYITKTRRLN